ncbi:MAG: MotA/TolQ/ExbB proton channel family protein [Treponema sp.]|uniref:MotA/TolQ/ExbB proton channel family protein n=1 Tax=Treponema sp. TaxID=166 RepID=UPI001B5320BF|nr:MotA/TolQ/ExbB proton channel family protein [Treponema sp.]MBP3773639.1 MotA/TolQ/ExbB proton channel family protein [Treponema sp.]MBQ9282697.1 MotA/TolQ/ExbB proton channel family protein [Treponema sp.]
MFDLLKSGGILMIPILICGLFATYIIIERCVYFASIQKRDRELRKNLEEALASGEFTAADAFCTRTGTPLAHVAKKAIDCRKLGESAMREIVQCELDAVAPQFDHWLTLLSTIANISTLLGLFGTVTGNIKAFGVLGSGGTMGNPAVLASSISEALMTTAAGLFVAIPALIFSNYLSRRADKCITEMEGTVTKLILRLTGRVM